jgi:hypothetical protein
MKKALGILSILTLLLAASCQKESVTPTRAASADVPTWRATPGRVVTGTPITGGVVTATGSDAITNPSTSSSGTVAPTDGSITDPNPEPDVIRKKGK